MSKARSKPLGRLHSVLIELMAISDQLDTPLMPNEAFTEIGEAVRGVIAAMDALCEQQYGEAKVKPKLPKDRQTTIKEALPANSQPNGSPVVRT